MNDRLAPAPRAPRWAWLLTLLLVLLLAAPVSAAAPESAAAAAVAPPAAPVLFGSLRSFLTNQSTMIQIGAVVGIIGIFFLSRSIRGG